MRFEHALRTLLASIAGDVRTGRNRIDDSRFRVQFLEALRVLEGLSPERVEAAHSRWTSKLEPLARHLESVLPSSDEFEKLARGALELLIGVPSSLSLVDSLEVQRAIHEFSRGGHLDTQTYALETRLLQADPGGSLRLTGVGDAFLRLRGRDAVRWLLTVEAAQSQGRWDQWRVPREVLVDARDDGIAQERDPEGELYFPAPDQTLSRLCALEVLHAHTDHDFEVWRYSLNPAMREAVTAVIDGGPWHTAARALLEDETQLALRLPLGAASSEVAVDQARLIAHEVRNALVPVRHHVDAILGAPPPGLPTDRLDAVKRGVQRTLAFVDQMVTMTELVGEAAAHFEVASSIRESLDYLDAADRVTLGELPSASIHGPRQRFTRAIGNVILNALQSTPEGRPIQVALRSAGSLVQVLVDDAGPGVAASDRSRVFEDGFTTRQGGSGFGLAYVKKVVEDLHGKVRCEESPLGGARFVIEVPETGSKP